MNIGLNGNNLQQTRPLQLKIDTIRQLNWSGPGYKFE